MGIADYIEHLREKPEHVRNRYAFWTALGVTLVIAIFWVSSFSFTDFSSRHDSVAETVKKVGSPGASMIAGVGDFVFEILFLFTRAFVDPIFFVWRQFLIDGLVIKFIFDEEFLIWRFQAFKKMFGGFLSGLEVTAT